MSHGELHCTCLDGSEWTEGVARALDAESQRLVVETARGKKLFPQLFVFVWGEDPTLYSRRVEDAHFERDLREARLRMERYIRRMPTEANAKYP